MLMSQPVMPQLVLLDFDGTLTDAWADAERVERAYMSALEQLGIDIYPAWSEARVRVRADRAERGWNWNGYAVCAATDPYLICGATAQEVIKQFGLGREDELTRAAYSAAYAPAPHKPGLQEFLKALGAKARFAVVTNSDTSKVEEALPGVQVYGDARKYMIDPNLTIIREHRRVDGLKRPVLLRRRAYYQLLDMVREDADLAWEEIAVVGDSYELDLALPAHLGAQVCLVESEGTLDFERTAVRAANGGVAASFDDVLRMLDDHDRHA